jgi:uncharacterized membrane protein
MNVVLPAMLVDAIQELVAACVTILQGCRWLENFAAEHGTSRVKLPRDLGN